MTTKRKPAPKKTDRTLGVTLLSAGAAAIGLGATLAALLLRRSRVAPAQGHAVPDLAPETAIPPVTTPPANEDPEVPALDPEARAPDHFRPDPTAVPTAEERESLRPATGPAPSLAADRGSSQADPQDAA